MNERIQRIKYILLDLLSAIIAWTSFFAYRKIFIERPIYGEVPLNLSYSYYLGVLIIAIFWLLLYYLSGYYREVFRKSRLKELFGTIGVCALGTVLLFFILILDDRISGYKDYYRLFFVLFGIQFFFTYTFRLLLTSSTIRKVRKGNVFFNTLIVGDNERAIKVYHEFADKEKSNGNKFVGFLCCLNKQNSELEKFIPNLGGIKSLKKVISEHNVKEVFLSLDSHDINDLEYVLGELSYSDIGVRAVPTMYDILAGKVKMSSVFGEPLMEVSHELMTPFQFYFKRLFDIGFALFALILLLPVLIPVVFIIKVSSKGPVLYAQERIGKFGKPFFIYKFRSMYVDAEKAGPQLSSKNDPRITRIGRFMRKTRVDEIPNFYNVLKGDMSLVGPRPERQFFIDQIVKDAPHYVYLQKVKPGVTSWGQVKYGYAENVEEMIERLKYDLIYIENMSLYVDFKILIYTFITIFRGKGV